ncbi:MAG TPA: 3-oxoacyl-[acyl-carrier-protein] synthase III C-terminal domain-containing protein [Thermoanaerobaculia bacterium]|jgi:3-oxoacyl-[acyl-carrier-protein] synthase-3|nr:3-oxoacyl-[acyl-carrier-protein] synthase III C-terminal domain-containing protein [Thermoanaerobaculia bacterium]
MTQARAVLAGTGVAVPPLQVDNHMLARIIETSDEWVRERSGVVTRYYVEPGVGSSDLGAQAARAALDDAGMAADEIDYIVCATMTPDHYFPGAGTLLQQKLGMRPLPCLDIRQQCAGYAYGLQMVDALIRSGIAKNVLLVGTDVHTSLMPFSAQTFEVLHGRDPGPLPQEDFEWNSRFRHLLVLFGDAAGAMVFKARESNGREGRGILDSLLYGDGNHKDILYVPGGGSARRPFVTCEAIREADTVPVMDGKAVFKLAVTRMPEVTRQVLAKQGYTPDDLDLVIMHQANLRINEKAQQILGLPNNKVYNNIQKYGNTTSATLPLAFHEARQAGMAPEGALVAFVALGAGLHWGAVLMRV